MSGLTQAHEPAQARRPVEASGPAQVSEALPLGSASFPRPHLLPLDGIRGLAILLVLAAHAFQANYAAGGPLTQALARALGYGIFGVDLFFVLSGFLITGILVDTVAAPYFFRSFYIRRVLRIFPLYYAVLLTLFALTPVLHLQWSGMGWLLFFDLQNLRPDTIGTFAPHPRIGLYHLWSLAVEEQFYLLWPAAVYLLRGRRTQLLWLVIVLSAAALLLRLTLIATGTGLLAIHVNTLCRADSLLFGGALALLYRTRHWPEILRLAPAFTLATFATLAASVLAFGPEPNLRTPAGLHAGPALYWFEGLRYTVLAAGFAGLIAWSLRPGTAVARACNLPTLRFFGRLSYGIYVLHAILLTALTPVLRPFLLSVTHSKGGAVLGSGLLVIAASVAAAGLSYGLIERPFLRLKRSFNTESPVPAVDARLADG